ncbi:hypothetical protein [Paenibacillus sp. sgz500992]|uniref:hypothetical protein n=1 Tax=Paenibacillus sp. sgz500992 TaxID=3242476 RepID=UPI0036D3666C
MSENEKSLKSAVQLLHFGGEIDRKASRSKTLSLIWTRFSQANDKGYRQQRRFMALLFYCMQK